MKQQTKDIIRWIALFPAICVVWLLAMFLCVLIEMFFYNPEVWTSFSRLFLILDLFVVPGITMFFAARYIAPKYKNIAGYGAIILCALWCHFFILTLAHSY